MELRPSEGFSTPRGLAASMLSKTLSRILEYQFPTFLTTLNATT